MTVIHFQSPFAVASKTSKLNWLFKKKNLSSPSDPVKCDCRTVQDNRNKINMAITAFSVSVLILKSATVAQLTSIGS